MLRVADFSLNRTHHTPIDNPTVGTVAVDDVISAEHRVLLIVVREHGVVQQLVVRAVSFLHIIECVISTQLTHILILIETQLIGQSLFRDCEFFPGPPRGSRGLDNGRDGHGAGYSGACAWGGLPVGEDRGDEAEGGGEIRAVDLIDGAGIKVIFILLDYIVGCRSRRKVDPVGCVVGHSLPAGFS